MVRLKAIGHIFILNSEHISIPVWCDWRLNLFLFSSTIRFYFNSSMVRLKVGDARTSVTLFNRFQFQYGAIEGISLIPATTGVITFQFQYGAIEGYNECGFLVARCEFQFQYGAIEGSATAGLTTSSNTFQFQYGAIEGHYRCLYYPHTAIFQFQYGAIEGKEAASILFARIDFNSSMVRLKDPCYIASWLSCQFQFQYGAIEGLIAPVSVAIRRLYFNSSMVRLKVR